ncbi:hypothetical protein C8R47DRAFT_1227293 [Mycena vitilis]|nr:hypothetical protein C8R47DRAFT_1227293 [Mycena vitilis]
MTVTTPRTEAKKLRRREKKILRSLEESLAMQPSDQYLFVPADLRGPQQLIVANPDQNDSGVNYNVTSDVTSTAVRRLKHSRYAHPRLL